MDGSGRTGIQRTAVRVARNLPEVAMT